MRSRVELTQHLLRSAYGTASDNLRGLSLDEALSVPAGGYRSVLGVLKHTAAWSHVYHSFAFEPEPRGWDAIDWPRGLRESVETSRGYLDEVIAWFGRAQPTAAWSRDAGAATGAPTGTRR